jgi:phosphatidylglycerol:prolipoprotein diacylglycerol transferase
MHQTLFVIPHAFFQGWLLGAWILIGLAILGFLFWKHGATQDTLGFVPILIIVGLIIHFVMPTLEVSGINPEDPNGPHVPLGLAIQGYGVFLLLGMIGGVCLSVIRCRQVGLNVDQVISMLFWMIVAGIIGARTFYVIQKYDEFAGLPLQEFVVKVLDMTKGGLVVYGSLIGGLVAAAIYVWRTRLPVLRVADVIAPGMVLGLAIGRLGCLMNGCCFGGVCSSDLPNIHFPPGSPPYMQQLGDGKLLGIEATLKADAKYPVRVKSVEAGSIAAELGIRPNDRLIIRVPDSLSVRAAKSAGMNIDIRTVIESERQGILEVPVNQFPPRSLGVHPTQIYSAINAGLLCLVLWFYFPFRKADGEVFALMLVLYSMGRFILELIRQDEAGQFGTDLTISQWVSMFAFVIGIVMMIYFRGRGVVPAGRQ